MPRPKDQPSGVRDGRLLRSERSQKAIADALFELVSEGNPVPTAEEIARRAGVSPRLVFHHYQNLDAIYPEVMSLQVEKVGPLLELGISPEMSFEERLSRFLDKRCQLLETVIPMRRAGIARAVESELVNEALRVARRFKAEQVSEVFAPELARFSGKDSKRRERAIQVAASWNTWDMFRHIQDLSYKQAREVMEFMIRTILDQEP